MIKLIRRLRSKKKKYTLRDVHFILPSIFNLRRGQNHHQSVAMIKFTMVKWTLYLIKNKTDAITFLIVERALLLRQIFVRGYTVYKRKKKEERRRRSVLVKPWIKPLFAQRSDKFSLRPLHRSTNPRFDVDLVRIYARTSGSGPISPDTC